MDIAGLMQLAQLFGQGQGGGAMPALAGGAPSSLTPGAAPAPPPTATSPEENPESLEAMIDGTKKKKKKELTPAEKEARRKARADAMANVLASGSGTTVGPASTQPATHFDFDGLTAPSLGQWPAEWQFILRLLQSVGQRQPVLFR